MRKQYYFLPSPRGVFAWDVDKLVALAKNLTIIDVNLKDIQEIDEPFWYQNNSTKPTCRSIAEHFKLMNETDLKYPIILSSDGRVMDGMHRVIKALSLGCKTIKAVKFSEPIKPDYVDVQENELPYD